MYSELYETWKREVENIKLERLSSDFYSKIISYLRKLKEESRMLDKRLLKNEMQNTQRMVQELVQTRYKKLISKAAEGKRNSSDFLTKEEQKIYNGVLPLVEAYQSFAESILRGHIQKVDIEQKHKKAVLRFLKEVQSIIGADMETYGPFKIEDIASLPVENSRILVKQGLAEKLDV